MITLKNASKKKSGITRIAAITAMYKSTGLDKSIDNPKQMIAMNPLRIYIPVVSLPPLNLVLIPTDRLYYL